MKTYRLPSARWGLLGLGVVLPLGAAHQATSPAPTAEVVQSPAKKVDINTADIPTLEAIPEIGTNMANAVVAARPFKSVEDLHRVVKIDAEKMATLRHKVFVSAVKPTAPAGPEPAPSGVSPRSPLKETTAKSAQEVTDRYDQKTKKKP